MKIVSGGQTGVDRAALDFALEHGIPCGGWCPEGRLDESGRIPDDYPVNELPGGGYAERTLANVRDSDGTLIIYCGELRGGTATTAGACAGIGRPYLLVDAAEISALQAGEMVAEFVRGEQIATLNVAGPRASEWPDGYDYAAAVLTAAFAADPQ